MTMARTRSGNMLGEHLADGGAIAEAEVIELLVAHGGADGVDVTGDVGGAEVRQQVPGRRLAAVDVVLADVEQRGFVLGRIDGVVDAVELREVATAVDVAGAEAAGVDAHDVEALGDVVREGEGERGGEAGRTRSRPARVDEQGADAVTAGGDPGDAQGEGVALGLVVVHRHVEGGALGVRRRSPPSRACRWPASS